MNVIKVKNIKEKVAQVLEMIPATRDDDALLTVYFWSHFLGKTGFIHDSDNGKFVYLRDIPDLPREDAIKRVRAIIQNEEGRFLPTSWAVAKKRKISEIVWKNYIANQKEG